MEVSEKVNQTGLSAKKILNISEKALPFFLFILCFGVSCLIKYSDGDDAFFLQKVTERPNFLDFTVFLTKTMNGRVAATSTLWLIFSNSIWLWRVINGFMMTAYVLLISGIVCLISEKVSSLNVKLIACASFAIMSVGVLGYSCMWITGSVNYLWPTTCGLITLYPFLKSIFKEDEYTVKNLLPAFITGVYTCLAQEQIAATVVAGSAIITVYRIIIRKKVDWTQLIAVLFFAVAFTILFLSPANSSRVGREIARWLPEYASFGLADKLFITAQWMANVFANSLRYVMLLIWGGLCYGFFRRKKTVLFGVSAAVTAVIFAACIGIDALSDLGLNHLDITKIIEHAPRFEDLSGIQIAMIGFWLCCIMITPVFIFLNFENIKVKYAVTVIVLAAVACLAVMLFSPTIYASGERTVFVSAMLLTVTASLLLGRKTELKGTVILVVILGIAAVLQLLQNKDYLLSMI